MEIPPTEIRWANHHPWKYSRFRLEAFNNRRMPPSQDSSRSVSSSPCLLVTGLGNGPRSWLEGSLLTVTVAWGREGKGKGKGKRKGRKGRRDATPQRRDSMHDYDYDPNHHT
jgi:hypothetical protein